MKTAKRLLALALAGVMALALLTGCSDSSSQAKQVEEYFRYRRGQFANYQKDETLDKKLEAIAQQFQPDWLDDRNGGLTGEARNTIKNELKDYLVTGSVYLLWNIPMLTILSNLVFLFLLSMLYEGKMSGRIFHIILILVLLAGGETIVMQLMQELPIDIIFLQIAGKITQYTSIK